MFHFKDDVFCLEGFLARFDRIPIVYDSQGGTLYTMQNHR
jgi:hypothetical protein